MDFPEELKYTKEHCWVRIEGDRGVIGITEFAQQELGAISAIELPEVGDDLEQDDSFGTLEARKTVAELYAPISGPVLDVNRELSDAPALVNDDPYDDGWLVIVEIVSPDELTSLMNADDYAEYVETNE
jgi:glycine cleavage system H protein